MQNQTITKPGYKNIPHIGLIPEDWEIKKLGDLFDNIGGTSLEEYTNKNGNYKFISIGNYTRDGKYLDNGQRIDINQKTQTKLLEKENLVMVLNDKTASGDIIGSTILIDENDKFIYNQRSERLIALDLINPSFAWNYINSAFFRKEVFSASQGGTQIYVNFGAIKKIDIRLPPILEQQKIAKILNTCDSQIETTKQIIQKLKSRNKGLQLQLLNGKNRLPGFTEKWSTLSLEDCLNYSPRPVNKPSENFFALGIRSHGKGIFHKNDFDPEDIAIDILYEVKEDDLIVNITFAWEQAIAIANKKDDGGLVSHRFPTYTFKLDKAIHRYFRYLIIQKRFKYMLDQISPGGAGRNRVLSKKDFLKLEVKIPKVEEQKAIADVLDKATEQLNEYKEKLAKLELQKKGLMQQLLTGKIRVKV